MMRFCLHLFLAAWCAAMLAAAPARADWDGDRKAVQEMIARTAPLERTEPEKAALAYREFFQQNQGMTPTWGVQILSRMIRLYAGPVKQAEVALQLCDWAIQRYEKQTERLVVVTDKAGVLIGQGKAAEAAALIEKEWDSLALARPEQNGPLLAQYCRAMDQTKKGDEATATLRKLVAANAMLLVDWYQEGAETAWIYKRIISDLGARREFDEALRWAKLWFVTLTPDKNFPAVAADVLRQVWLARDGHDRTWRAFLDSQVDFAKPNPLAEVKLPEIDADAMRKQVAEIHWGLSVGRAAGLVAAGDLGDAMLLARDTLVNHNVNSGMMMACTVFHAADLNMRRVDAFRQYLKAPQGQSPMDEFLQQHPPKGKTAGP